MDPLTGEIIASIAWLVGGEAALGLLVFLWYIGFGGLTAVTQKVWVGMLTVLGAWVLALIGSGFVLFQVVIHAVAAAQLAFG